VSVDRAAPDDLARHRRLLWGLSYRMTGSVADADDVVQDTFVRAIERPPHRDADVRPWLVKVAMNLARDRLRARKRLGYKGVWLPAALPDDPARGEEELASIEPEDPASPARRYEILESVSVAFLLALEALKPRERAVVLLCDVFDYPVKEAAQALGTTPGNVKVVHHRARKALATYDTTRPVPGADLTERTRAALQAFVGALAAGDEAGARALLADDAIALNDGGGEFFAAGLPLVGAERVLKATFGIVRHGATVVGAALADLNALPALVVHLAPTKPGVASRVTIQVELDRTEKIRAIYTTLATAKLAAVEAFAGSKPRVT
jgi:RNA polymerase sigma factor (sigma-70 family)